MDDTKKLITPLLELGLNKYEARVYLALISEGTATAKNLSDITSIPYGKVYEIINLLCTKGFCIILPTKPMKCKAASPLDALETTKKTFYSKFINLEKQIISNLNPLFEKTKEFSEPKGFFWVVNGRKNIIKKIDELLDKAKEHIYIFATENGIKRISIHKESLLKAKERGVEIKIGGTITDTNKEDIYSLNFCEIYHVPCVSSQLFVVDNTKSILVDALPDDESITYGRDLGVLINNNSFSALLKDAFTSKLSFSKKIILEQY
ncbi:MAG: helix-turn-helix domain-containing protein [Nanoarchaeota archaeon]|nr:hypothetical protein [Nanoarchaeota archaeon]MBU1631821.1 hypothetical protein [Nanoarchaeota archaeon]MBU1875612.1 hypothetical protein [Nanoarchaeota archaeon]